MAKRISERTRSEIVETTREFERKTRNGGYSFQCKPDPRGGYTYGSPTIAAEVNRLENNPDYTDKGFVTTTRYVTEPAVIECSICSAHVTLYGFTNTCECGADYNMSGQELAPREQWGEETGESVADILAADSDTGF